jgi:hypothetical protein
MSIWIESMLIGAVALLSLLLTGFLFYWVWDALTDEEGRKLFATIFGALIAIAVIGRIIIYITGWTLQI